MYALLEGTKKPESNTRYMVRKVKNYFKPIFQKKSYKRRKKKS